MQLQKRSGLGQCSRRLAFSAMIVLSLCPNADAEGFKAKVVSVSDGDSLTVLHNDEKEKVILYGVDCPEIKQAYGPEARQFTNDACYLKTVSIDVRGRDSKGRTIANVTLSDGTLLNKVLVQKGLAWWSDKYAPNDKDFKDSHLAAKAGKIGLWSAPGAIPPWIFRNGERSVNAKIMKGE